MFSLETWCRRDLPHGERHGAVVTVPGGVWLRISMCLVVVDSDCDAEVCVMAWWVWESGGARHMTLCSELFEAVEEEPVRTLFFGGIALLTAERLKQIPL